MNLGEIKDLVMFQTNNDSDDLGDFMPYLQSYIDEGYDLIVEAWTGEHEHEDYPALRVDKAVPETPEWTHKAIADWATWCVYRNGSQPKQNRGMAFREAFESVLKAIKSCGGANGKVENFFNIPW